MNAKSSIQAAPPTPKRVPVTRIIVKFINTLPDGKSFTAYDVVEGTGCLEGSVHQSLATILKNQYAPIAKIGSGWWMKTGLGQSVESAEAGLVASAVDHTVSVLTELPGGSQLIVLDGVAGRFTPIA
jgi:hypothetical protein